MRDIDLKRNCYGRVCDGLTIAGHQIRYNGVLTRLKNAAVMAIRSVDPSFEPTKTYPNGFKFWHAIDATDSTEHKISKISGWDNITDEALRQRVLNKIPDSFLCAFCASAPKLTALPQLPHHIHQPHRQLALERHPLPTRRMREPQAMRMQELPLHLSPAACDTHTPHPPPPDSR